MNKKFLNNSFLFAANALFVEDLFERYLANPESVSEEWQKYFNESSEVKQSQPSWASYKPSIIEPCNKVNLSFNKEKLQEINSQPCISDKSKEIIDKFRTYGHFSSNLDPLAMGEKVDHDLPNDNNYIDLISKLRKIYCNNIGFEFAHIQNQNQKDWLYKKSEELSLEDFTSQEQKSILTDLIEIEGFEQFLHSRFPGAKRFSIEGGDSSIIAVSEIIRLACEVGIAEEVVIGMSHRGRLNMLTKVLQKSYVAMLSEFQGNSSNPESLNLSGDVKYHLGKSSDFSMKNGKKIHISLVPNPSHLEAVNSVVLGKIRAKQDLYNDFNKVKVMGIILHGDAAFAGQGIVAESLSLSDLEAYKVGGVVHIVINNQVGFTTSPLSSRKSRYPTEVAKIIGAPIIHVNADDPESVIKAAKIAEEFRQTFQKDVIIDIVCYRRYGHNEGDEPMFTQPLMYKKIKDHKTVATLYNEKLVSCGSVSQDFFNNIKNDFQNKLEDAYNKSQTYCSEKSDWLDGLWSNISRYDENKLTTEKTGISILKIKKIGLLIVKYPESFNINNKLKRLFESKKQMFETGENFDWSTAEALAFGSLLTENVSIRITGQDVRRGTFSHRHAVIIDQDNQSTYTNLNNLEEGQRRLEIYDSNLSEYAALGYEYGYSTVDPNCLTIWEAQFGDFSNGAQIIIDQFISCSEYKWLRMSAIVMLLPHGYEGMGPEHSSARLERYLQLCAENNIQVVNITTPANYFHALRRQIIGRSFRKPLVVMSPKSLLRHRLAVSKIEDMAEGSFFLKVIDESVLNFNIDLIKKVILCSGKVYYDLLEAREKLAIKDIVIIRIEQYYPFPEKEITEIIKKYKNAEFVWCQEEPENMGAWNFIHHYIEKIIESEDTKYKKLVYVGRKAAASPATGSAKTHNHEQEEFINKALK